MGILSCDSRIVRLTGRADPPPAAMRDAKRLSLGLFCYLAFYAVVVVGWGLGLIKQALPEGPMRVSTVLGYKLVFHVAIPGALIMRLGGNLRETFDPGLWRKGVPLTFGIFAAICFGLLAILSPSLRQIAETGVKGGQLLFWVGLSWLWMSIEAGLCEEYLFRAGLQSALASWLRSPLGGILIASVLFALAHWPGLYLRGGPEVDGWSTNPVQVAAFTIATLSPVAIFMGVLWARTRSLVLIVFIHGAIDALPHTAAMIQTFG